MNFDEFREAAAYIAAYIVKHNQNVKYYPVIPSQDKAFGFIFRSLPRELPEKSHRLDEILYDLDNSIIPGIVHWNHPHFYAYFACGNSYPSILAEMLITGLGAIGYNWSSCPALTELEIHAVDMYGRLLNLPSYLLYEESCGRGGGFLNSSSSDNIHQAMLAARNRLLKRMDCCPEKEKPTAEEKLKVIASANKLVAYCSSATHSCVTKSAALLMTQIRILEVKSSESDSLKGEIVEKQIKRDLQDGLIPYVCVASIGTTETAAVDQIREIANVLKNYPDVWLHIDGSYGGSALMLDRFKFLLSGVLNIDSMNVSPYKWSLVAIDGSVMWTKDRKNFLDTYKGKLKYMNYENTTDLDISSHLIPFERRFRSLRLWFTIRCYGKRKLQSYLENHIKLAQRFADHIRNDHMFRVVNTVNFSLVCFCVNGSQNTDTTEDMLTSELLGRLNHSGRLHMVPGHREDEIFIRFVVTYEYSNEQLIDEIYEFIKSTALEMVLERTIQFHNYSSIANFRKSGIAGPTRKSLEFDSLLLPSEKLQRMSGENSENKK